MNELCETIIIKDNELTDELRDECIQIFNKVRNMSLEERRLHYEELNLLLQKILNNKNKNYNDFVNKLKQKDLIIPVQIASIRDSETENIIIKIFAILTNDLEVR